MQYTDQTGYKITLNRPAKRIVSIVPSQTELLYHLGITPIAQSIFCVHPSAKFKNAPKIGGTKKLQLEAIKRLNPDLVIGNKEENDQVQIEELRQHFPVWLSDISTLEDAVSMISTVGELCGNTTGAQVLRHQVETGFNDLSSISKGTALYMIWRKPYMAAGRRTFINCMLEYAGYSNAISEKNSRYPIVDMDEIEQLNPSEILLSSEPYPFKEKHIQELKKVLPNTKISLVDGEIFSWYGPRLLETINYLKTRRSFP